jgi:hypothetical protein
MRAVLDLLIEKWQHLLKWNQRCHRQKLGFKGRKRSKLIYIVLDAAWCGSIYNLAK